MPVERAKRGKVLIIKDVGSLIITIRNQKVIVDRDLAEIYGVETRRLNEKEFGVRPQHSTNYFFNMISGVLHKKVGSVNKRAQKACLHQGFGG